MKIMGIIIENYSVDNLISIYGEALMFRKNKTTAKAASGNDLNTLLDVFDKIISGEISHTGESPADHNTF